MIERQKLKRFIRQTGTKKRILYTYSENNPELKELHETYVKFLNEHFIPSSFSHAYTKNRSIYTNAILHLNNDVFIKIDVKNYFPSLNHRYLSEAMYFELNKKRPDSITLEECTSLISNSSITKTGLPLGLMTSPVLSNIYMKKFDSLLYAKLKRTKLKNIIYTRYADDLFISFQSSELNNTTYQEIIDICKKELSRCYLKINDKKTKLINLDTSNHVKLAGINLVKSVDGKRRLTVSRKTIKDLYFRAISVHDAIKLLDLKFDDDAELNFVKGMQSFILSIEKKGYSQILSPAMHEKIKSCGYDSLENLIASLKSSKPNQI